MVHRLYVDQGGLKSISGMNLFHANKNLCIILFILYFQNKIGPNQGI